MPPASVHPSIASCNLKNWFHKTETPSHLSRGAAANVFVGDTYNFTCQTKTAPGGYEPLGSFINWPNAVFQVISADNTYSQPVAAVNSSPYADACGRNNNPASPTHRSCGSASGNNYPSDKSGDTIITTYVVEVLSAETSALTGVVHDFSGSRY